MSTQLGSSGVSREDLALYFDGELTGAEAHELQVQIDADPELRAELDQLGALHGLVAEGLTQSSEEVPQARFEQLWDEIDRGIAREKAVAQAEHESIWNRLWTALKPMRLPAAVAAAAGALVVAMQVSDEDPNNDDRVASVQEPPASPTVAPALAPPKTPVNPPTQIAVAPVPPEAPAALPPPKQAEAEIHSVEFEGNGQIGRFGTVTVLYVEEPLTPKDSERSL